MKWSHRWLLLALTLILPLAAAPASAQYMYLDSNGDGVHTAADVMNGTGVPTTVDVWITTNENRDGSEAVCDTDDGILQINSYVVNRVAAGGGVTYSGFSNQQAGQGWTVAFGEVNAGNGLYKNGFGGPATAALPPGGPYRLMTLTITSTSGAPSIQINDINSNSPDFTSFGTACSGNDFDNTYKLSGPGGGSDWTDADGLGPPAGANAPPVLDTITDKTTNEGVLLSFTATATDTDADPLTFTLGTGAPTGAAITSGGAFTWTPTEAQGPGFYPIEVIVSDGEATDNQTFNVTVNEVNTAPVLGAIGNKTVSEGSLLSFTATATDTDVPANTLSFALGAGSPPGAAITTGGAFTWTPTETQGPGVFPITIGVTDGTATDTETINVTVNEANVAPVLDPIGNKTGTVGVAVTFTATATDADIPANTLAFSLGAGAPAGAAIGATTGAFSWTPSASGTFPVTVIVTDNGTPPLNDTETIQIGVGAAANAPPVLAAIGNKTVNELVLLSFTATATDPDAGQTLTFTLGAGAPAGAAITTGGNFTWTPTEAQGPAVTPITVIVTDNGTGNLSDSETIQVTVNEVNVAPVLAAIGNKTVNELALLSFTATATDADVPANTLTFTLGAGAPAGAAITAGGNFTWTPTEAQGPSTSPITVIVTDNGTPALNDTELIQVTVNEVNVAPVLGAIGNQSGTVGNPVTFTATATDADVPANTLAFTLGAGAPAGATIGATTGNFSWTPSATGTFPVTVIVTDNGTPPLNDTETIQITVGAVPNAPPVLAAIGDKTVNEEALLSFTATATDSDVPAQTLTFSLGAGAPAGAAITAGGNFTWTPTEAQGPAVTPITVIVTDNGTGNLSDSETINVTVNEVNVAPVLAAIGDKTVNEQALLSFTATATDADVPANTLTFTLGAGAPAGAAITAGGNFTWTPTEDQGGSSFPITVIVTDNGTPALNDTELIRVTVNEINVAPVLAAIGNQSGTIGIPVTFTATATDADIPENELAFTLGAGAPAGATIGATTGAFSWTPSATGTFPVTVIVTDDGATPLSDTETIQITVGAVPNAPPVLAAIGNKTVNEGELLSFTATATDGDSDPITFSLGAGAPAGAAITAGGDFTWTPTEAQGPGAFPITVIASDGTAQDTETIDVTVNEINIAPALDAIADQTVDEGTLLTFSASATDADLPANTLTFSLAGGAPTGATITASGLFTWTPAEDQEGLHTITVEVSDGTDTDTETFDVTVNEMNQAPALDAIANQSGSIGVEVTVDANATDADIPSNTLVYSLDDSPAGATIDSETGAISWTPSGAGVFNFVVRVTDNGAPVAFDTEDFTVSVDVQNEAPVLGQPSDMTVNEGATDTQQLTATDGNGDALTFAKVLGPDFVTVSGAGVVTVSPGFADAGTYPVRVSVSDGSLSDEADFNVTVVNVNQGPTADAGPDKTGTVGVPVSFDGSGSSDPDGDALTYSWDFGDASTGTGVTTSHTYMSTGTFTVTLTVDDGTSTDTDTAIVTIVDTFAANAFFVGGNKSTKLASGKPQTCANIEPVDGSFDITDVDLSTITMSYQGASITAIADKTTLNSDKNGNGVNEILACFSKDDLRDLFASLPPGNNPGVAITIEGDLVSGGSFSVNTTHDVVGTNKTFNAVASPNPLNPSTKLEFKLSQAGTVKVQVYDLHGRLVKTLQDGSMPAGYNTVTWDGSSASGSRVASGMYYFRVRATEGESVVRVAVVK